MQTVPDAMHSQKEDFRVGAGQALVFAAKQSLLRIRQSLLDFRSRVPLHQPDKSASCPCLISEVRTPLWNQESPEELQMLLGKVQNLRVSTHRLDGICVPKGTIFSFWRQVGRATRAKGYSVGRELRNGCLVPTIGGGLCQLTNSLYRLALESGCEILERHAHSQSVPGAERGLDATVAWNYVDLRFAPPFDLLITAKLTADELVLSFWGNEPWSMSPAKARHVALPVLQRAPNSCATCGQAKCFRNAPHLGTEVGVGKAIIVDGVSAEFQEWLAQNVSPEDIIFSPIDGGRYRIPRYAWKAKCRKGFAPGIAIKRSLEARSGRNLPPPQLRAKQLEAAEELASALGRKIPREVRHLVVAQSLLPALWESGALGGRTFDVLIERLPLEELHRRLDAALAAFPDQKLLGDFRAPGRIVSAETEALAEARQFLTPHAGFAKLLGCQAELLDWHCPLLPRFGDRKPTALVFPGPTAARKGAYAVREVARRLNLPVIVLGGELEGAGFWDGINVRHTTLRDPSWLEDAYVVLQPSICEDRPIALMMARNAGIPIVAGDLCGLEKSETVRYVAFGDVEGIVETIGLIVL